MNSDIYLAGFFYLLTLVTMSWPQVGAGVLTTEVTVTLKQKQIICIYVNVIRSINSISRFYISSRF